MNFEHKGQSYKIGALNAKKQFHIVRRLAPVFSGLASLGGKIDGIDSIESISKTLSTLSDADADYIIDNCLEVVERKSKSGGYSKVIVAGSLMFEDIDMMGMISLTWQVLQNSLSDFFAELPQDIAEQAMESK